MTPTVQERKLYIILFTALFGLFGFLLECGPVGGAFGLALGGPTVFTGLSVELQSFGFLAYLALAVAVTLGLHLGETEPTLREPTKEEQRQEPDVELVVDRTYPRVRPELHQLRIMGAALLGFAALKLLSLLWLNARFENLLGIAGFTRLFEFGLVYIALGWFLTWQFLRDAAAQYRWVRIQEELMGGNTSKAVAAIVLLKPLWFVIIALRDPRLLAGTVGGLTLLLHLGLIAFAVVLWTHRPAALRRTLVGLATCGVGMLLLTLILAFTERALTG